MECCKDKKYNITLKSGQMPDDAIGHFLKMEMELLPIQANIIVERLKSHGKCKIFEGTIEEIPNITAKLVKNNISFEVT